MNNIKSNLLENILKRRYFILSFTLVTLMILTAFHGYHTGDFWEHNAVVKELATNPISPHNPLLLVNSPHVFYSPYSLSIALFSRFTGLDTITSLSIAGIFNLILFLVSFKFFVSLISSYEHAPFYSLLFVLLLWGPDPWYFSGFYNLDSLKYLISYPSFFSGAITFLTLSIFIKAIKKKRLELFLGVVIGLFLTFISHPLTFIVLIVGLIAISLSRIEIGKKEYLALLSAIITALILAAFWPYYSVFEFLFKESGIFHISNEVVYENILNRMYPVLLVVPILIIRIKSDHRDPLVIMFFCLLAIYIYGAIFKDWSYGRVISYMIIILQIFLGDFIANLEDNFRPKKYQIDIARLSFIILILIILMPISYGSVKNVLSSSFRKINKSYNKYSFLSKYTNQYDVILSDLETSWYVPSFGGKVVASQKPLAFVKDNLQRREETQSFFNDKIPINKKLKFIQMYKVDYLLLNKQIETNWQQVEEIFGNYGSINFEDSNFILLKLNNKITRNAHL